MSYVSSLLFLASICLRFLFFHYLIVFQQHSPEWDIYWLVVAQLEQVVVGSPAELSLYRPQETLDLRSNSGRWFPASWFLSKCCRANDKSCSSLTPIFPWPSWFNVSTCFYLELSLLSFCSSSQSPPESLFPEPLDVNSSLRDDPKGTSSFTSDKQVAPSLCRKAIMSLSKSKDGCIFIMDAWLKIES